MSPRKLSTFLESVLADTLRLPAAATQVRLLRSWGTIVGPLLGGKTSPGKIRNGVLTILVPNHAWAQELQLAKPALLKKIQSAVGEEKVREIRFAVDSGIRLPAAPGIPEGGGQPSPPEAEAGPEHPLPLAPDGLDGVRDPETRNILLSIFRKSSRRQR